MAVLVAGKTVGEMQAAVEVLLVVRVTRAAKAARAGTSGEEAKVEQGEDRA